MSGIVKPPAPAIVQREHPILRNMVFCVPMLAGAGTTVRDCIVSNHGSLTNLDDSAWVGGSFGWAVQTDGSDGQHIALSKNISTARNKYTMMWAGDCTAGNDSEDIFFYNGNDNGGYGIAVLGDPLKYAAIIAGKRWMQSTAAPSVSGGDVVVYQRQNPIDQIWVNGLLVYSASNAEDSLTVQNTATIGAQWLSGLIQREVAARHSICAMWARFLQPDEISQLAWDPFCFLRPAQQSPAWLYAPATGGNTYTHSVSAPFAALTSQSAIGQYQAAGTIPGAAVPGQTVIGQYPVTGAVPTAAVSDQAALARYVTASLAPLSAVTDQAAIAAYLAGVSAQLACSVEDLVSAVYRETGIIPAALLPAEVASALYAVAPAAAMSIEPGASAVATYSASDLVRLSLITDQHISIPGLGRGWLLRVLQSGRYS